MADAPKDNTLVFGLLGIAGAAWFYNQSITKGDDDLSEPEDDDEEANIEELEDNEGTKIKGELGHADIVYDEEGNGSLANPGKTPPKSKPVKKKTVKDPVFKPVMDLLGL